MSNSTIAGIVFWLGLIGFFVLIRPGARIHRVSCDSLKRKHRILIFAAAINERFHSLRIRSGNISDSCKTCTAFDSHRFEEFLCNGAGSDPCRCFARGRASAAAVVSKAVFGVNIKDVVVQLPKSGGSAAGSASKGASKADTAREEQFEEIDDVPW